MEFIISNLGKIAIGILAGFLLFVIVKNSTKIMKFLLQVRTELVKVSWPTKKEVMASTVVILVLTAILTLYVGSIDLCLSKILSAFLR